MPLHRDLTAADVMTTDVLSLGEDVAVLDALRALLARGVSGAPVVDKQGRMVGVLTEEDLLGVFYEGHRDLGRVRIGQCAVLGGSLVTRRVLSVKPETQAREIAKKLMIKKFKRVPVVDAGRRVVGIVSRRDLLRAMVEGDQPATATPPSPAAAAVAGEGPASG